MPEGVAMIPLRLAAYGAAAALVVATYHFTPVIGPHARLEHLEANRDEWRDVAGRWKANARGWQAAFKKAEERRVEEQAASRAAVNAEALQCDARVKQARASAKVIREIAYAPVKADAAGCPLRGIIGADRLRDALQPGPGG
jgi:hypothetical protein